MSDEIAISLKPNTVDVITSQTPEYVRESFPHFVQFLKGYYEWLETKGNSYYQLGHHLDYLNFKKSVDEYTELLKKEYLNNIPSNLLENDVLFIEWSKKLNLSIGSKESYKFLFQMMFGESSTDIYLPKDNILRVSDGNWIHGQNKILVTNPGDPDRLLHRRIEQKWLNEFDEYVYSSAIVDSFYTISYDVGFNLVELTMTEVEGEFLYGYELTVEEESGNIVTLWPVSTIIDFEIEDGGKNFSINDELFLAENFVHNYSKTLTASAIGEIDTQITTVMNKSQIKLVVDGLELDSHDFEYDGQIITSDAILIDSEVYFEMQVPFYRGRMYVSDIEEGGAVRRIRVADSPIILSSNEPIDLYSPSPFVSNLKAKAVVGIVRPQEGYYIGNHGQTSSDMYLQDGEYYQEYSYEILTEQDIMTYADIVKRVLHPSGFKMYGRIRILHLIEAIIDIGQENHWINVIDPLLKSLESVLYGAGGNYRFIWKKGIDKWFMSPRMYKGNEIDERYINVNGYTLQDKMREREFNEEGFPIVVNTHGYMTRVGWSDADVWQPEEFFEKHAYGHFYMESSYVVEPELESKTYDFQQQYINRYNTIEYWDDEYVEEEQ